MISLLHVCGRFALALTMVPPFARAAASAEDWSFKAGAEVFSIPAFDGKSLYFGSCDGNFYCLDKTSGKELWRRGGFNRVDSTPVIYAAAIVFCAVDDRVCALGREAGDRLWELRLKGCGLSNPKLCGDQLLIPSHNQISILNAANGKLVGAYEVLGTDGRVCWNSKVVCAVASEDVEANYEAGFSRVMAFQRGAKNALWTTKLGGACLGGIACDETRCYLGARDGRFYAIDLATGKVAWQIECRNMIPTRRKWSTEEEQIAELKPRVWADGHVELAGGRVLFTVSHQDIDDSSAIVAAERKSGKILWIASHPTQICGRFVVAHGSVIAAAQDRQLVSTRMLDGKAGFAIPFSKGDRGEFAGVAVDREFLFVAGADATVSRISLRSIIGRSW